MGDVSEEISAERRRERRAARASVVAVGSLAAAAFALVRFRDPHVGGSYPACPFLELTGLWCPLCGGLRSTNDLLGLRFVDALSSNVLAVVLVLSGGAYGAYWAAARWRGSAPRRVVLGLRSTALMAFVVVGFAVLRNVPLAAALAP